MSYHHLPPDGSWFFFASKMMLYTEAMFRSSEKFIVAPSSLLANTQLLPFRYSDSYQYLRCFTRFQYRSRQQYAFLSTAKMSELRCSAPLTWCPRIPWHLPLPAEGISLGDFVTKSLWSAICHTWIYIGVMQLKRYGSVLCCISVKEDLCAASKIWWTTPRL